MSEKFCLKWNDFKENVSAAFGEMREDQDFADITLASEDGQQLSAHKVILAASSPFFHKLLKRHKHTNQLIYMRGMKFEELVAVVDFLYYGEANIFQDNLDIFLNLAEELQLKGLTGENNSIKDENPTKYQQTYPHNSYTENKNPPKKYIQENNTEKYASPSNEMENIYSETTVAILSQTFSSRISELDEQIKSMTVKGQSMPRMCKVCGKEGTYQNIKDHIEIHHIEGVCLPCDLCQKTFRSRNNLRMHKYNSHK